MEKKDGNISSFNNNIIIMEDGSLDDKEFLIKREDYEKFKKLTIDPSDLETNKATLLPEHLGKYTSQYIKGIKETEELLFFQSDQMLQFQSETEYLDEYDDLGIFNFLTGSEKSGKTFSLLCLKLFEDDNNYRLYLNDNFITELENEKKFEEIMKMFFYEISKIFYSFDDYFNFSKSFLEKNFENGINEINFKALLLKFIDDIDSFIQKNSDRYKKMVIIIDDFELDERNPEKLKNNNNFINCLYEKRSKSSKIHFSFISPINDNYIQKCILFSLDLNKRLATSGLTKKDKDTGIVYYPFTYYNNCFFDQKENNDLYKKDINEKIKVKYKISGKYLNRLNYSLYHLNNINKNCNKNDDKKSVEEKAKKYLQQLEDESYKDALSFYQKNNTLMAYNLDKVKKCHEIVCKKDNIEYETLIEILNFIPIHFLDFHLVTIKLEGNMIEQKYNISYLYDFYGESISKYFGFFQNDDYEEDEIYKPSEKGDILERKVIESIKDGYFKNFKPDKIIEIHNIYYLSEYNDINEYNYKEEIKLFEEIFSDKKYNLIMITQKHSNGKKYDLAFIQKYKNGKYQFILLQITRKKNKGEMFQYNNVKLDCYNFANFFAIFDDIEVKRYHFLFVFQAGFREDTNNMQYCNNNGIKFIKFCIYDKKPFFLDSRNQIITDIVFDRKSYSLVELISNKKLKELDNLSSSSEYSLLGQKREKINRVSKAKYNIGINIYKKVQKIFKGQNFELSDNFKVLEEDKYFHIYIGKGEDGKKIYYLVYLKYGMKIIEIFNKNKKKKKTDNDSKDLEKEISKPGTTIECFKLLEK